MASINPPKNTHYGLGQLADEPTNLLELLDGMEFPASLPEIVDYAIDQGAAEDTLQELRAMPERDYDSIEEVNRYHAQIEEVPGQENLFDTNDAPDSELPIHVKDKPVILQRR